MCHPTLMTGHLHQQTAKIHFIEPPVKIIRLGILPPMPPNPAIQSGKLRQDFRQTLPREPTNGATRCDKNPVTGSPERAPQAPVPGGSIPFPPRAKKEKLASPEDDKIPRPQSKAKPQKVTESVYFCSRFTTFIAPFQSRWNETRSRSVSFFFPPPCSIRMTARCDLIIVSLIRKTGALL